MPRCCLLTSRTASLHDRTSDSGPQTHTCSPAPSSLPDRSAEYTSATATWINSSILGLPHLIVHWLGTDLCHGPCGDPRGIRGLTLLCVRVTRSNVPEKAQGQFNWDIHLLTQRAKMAVVAMATKLHTTGSPLYRKYCISVGSPSKHPSPQPLSYATYTEWAPLK